jgi:hypothetical protein
MQFQGAQRGSVERILANYYLAQNVWFNAPTNSFRAGLRGPNLRGCIVSAVRTTSFQAAVPVYGTAVTLGGSQTDAQWLDCCQDIPLGVLDTEMVIGIDSMVNTWVTVCAYGWMDQIAVGNTILSNHDYLVMQRDGEVATFGSENRGLAIGYGRPGALAPRKLQGILQITLKTPLDTETIFVNMDGTANTAGTGGDSAWAVQPGKNNQAVLDSSGTITVPQGDAPVIAMRTSKSPVTPLESVTGGTGIPAYVEGFVFMLGLSKNVG